MDLVHYIATNYFKDASPRGIANVRNLLNLPGVYTEQHGNCVVLYIKLSDFGMELLRRLPPHYKFSLPYVLSLLSHPGENVFFLLVLADGLRSIRQGYRWFMERNRPDTISWVDKTRFYLHEYRGSLWAVH